jgi:hypothetical protein
VRKTSSFNNLRRHLSRFTGSKISGNLNNIPRNIILGKLSQSKGDIERLNSKAVSDKWYLSRTQNPAATREK